MPVIDLKSDLRDLKYSKDLPGGGTSNQPYITTDIPAYTDPYGTPPGASGLDFILRGGGKYDTYVSDQYSRVKDLLEDTSLLGGNIGENWKSKQVALSRQSTWRFLFSLPISQIYDKKQTLDQLSGGVTIPGLNIPGFNINVPEFRGGIFSYGGNIGFGGAQLPSVNFPHLYKQGGISMPSLGWANPLNYTNAYKAADRIKMNRMINLYKTKVSTYVNGKDQAYQIANSAILGVAPEIVPGSDLLLQTYYGGTDNYGGQVSIIPRHVFSTNKKRSFGDGVLTYDQNILGKVTYESDAGKLGKIYGPNSIAQLIDFRRVINTQLNLTPEEEKLLPSTDYNTFNRISTYNTGDPGQRGLIRNNPNKGVRGADGKPTLVTTDHIAMKPLLTNTDDILNDDMIKFKISAVDPDQPSNRIWFNFRAFLGKVSDGFRAKYQSYNYIGRAESFYKYQSFDRSMGVEFTVAVQSRQEQYTQYQKLNYLASLTAPNYKDGFMRGNITYLTIGDWFNDVPGVLTSVKLSIPDQASWEIARNDDGTVDDTIAQLPFVVEVSLDFEPIHNFVPQRGSKFIGYDINTNQNELVSYDSNPYGIT